MNAIVEHTENVVSIDAHPALVDPMVAVIERVALDPDADLDKLERMLSMKERMDAQASRKAFDVAISEAKSAIPPILKTGTVDYENSKGDRTHFKHETLDGIASVVDPILSQHGLSYRFRSGQENGLLTITCVVSHREGHFEETALSGAPDQSGAKNNYQAMGSAATYLQRYTLKLALGLSAAKDDDAALPDAPGTKITQDQWQELRGMLERTNITEEVVCIAEKIEILAELPASRFAKVKDNLSQDIARAEASA